MALNLPVGGGGGDFKRAPSGSHISVCNLVADCGLQPGSQAFPKPKRKLYIRFEIPSERIEYEKDGKTHEGPMTIGSFYSASMNEKATLRKHLEGWRGKAFSDEQAEQFDVSAIAGKACMLSVIESDSGGKTYSNIASISALPKGITVPQAENELLVYVPDDDGRFSSSVFAKLPQWLQEKIDAQLKPVAKPQAHETSADSDFIDDDIPF
jgi:hypothetical protein